MKYVTIATFNSRLEAETVAHALDPHGIPYLIQGHDIGMFGAAGGGIPGGIRLMVPDFVAEQVEAMLDCVIRRASNPEDSLPHDPPPPL
jgi:hypothetical protein